MARTSSVWKVLALGVLAHAALAQAQQPPAKQAPSQQPPSSAPPKLERIEEGSDTPITVTPQKRNEKKIIEKRQGGQVTEVQVTTGKSSYVMKANPPDTTYQPGDATTSGQFRPPQWKVLEFDFGKKKQKEPEEAAEPAAGATPAAVPPPPPLPSTK